MFGFNPVAPNLSCKVLGSFEFVFDESFEDVEPSVVIVDQRFAPGIHGALHRLESALGFINADADRVLKRKVLAVLRKYDVEIAGERKIGAYEDTQSDNNREPERLRVGVADTEGELCAFDALVKRHHAEEIAAVFRDRIFFRTDRDMPESKLFLEGVHDLDVGHDLVRGGRSGGRHEGELLASQFSVGVCTSDEGRFHIVLSRIGFELGSSCHEARLNLLTRVTQAAVGSRILKD